MPDNVLGPLSEINRLIRENRIAEFQSPNLALGLRPLEFSAGRSRWSWETQPPQVLNPFGLIQGGYLALFVDDLLSTAIGSVLEEGEWAVTAETKVTYVRALKPSSLIGEARVVRRSRALAFLEASVAERGGEIAVLASSTWAISRR